MPKPRTILRVIAGILWLLTASIALATSVPYRVEIQAPDPLRKLLTEHLRVVDLRDDKNMGLDQLRSVYRRTPKEIEELVATEGYFSPKITSALEESAGVWIARFTVDPGPPTRVKTAWIDFTGGIISSEADDTRLRRSVRDAWYLNEGAVFRQADWAEAKRSVLQRLLAERFPKAQISSSEARVDAPTHAADLHVTLDSGPAFTIDELEISGLRNYRPAIVERLNTIEPGTPYKLDDMLALQQRLQDTGYFSSVLVDVDTETATPDNAPLRVTVVERRPRRISFGVGYSTDTKNRVSVEYEDVNFLDRGLRLKSRLRLETLQQEFAGEVFLPRTGGGYDPRVFGSYANEDIQGQITRKYGFGGALSETRGNIERAVSVQYVYEDQILEGAPGNIRQAVFSNFSWTQRAIDNLLFPSRGYLVNLQLGAAPKVFDKSESFVRSYARGAYYLPVGDAGTFVFRTELGYVAAESSKQIPSDFLFRTGGDVSVRGYPYQGIGVQEGEAVVGGRVLGVASAEYTHWITRQWGAAVFYDTGDAVDTLSDFNPKSGYGVGVRWRSPVGPLNLDVAYGEDRNEYRVHFTAGIAF
ncbi:MAG TPA: autotransporter assembly complex family protein [Burkholderiales bacterium]|nr:autotransporter assembly complex family protein [Burkholderiales bacterium]